MGIMHRDCLLYFTFEYIIEAKSCLRMEINKEMILIVWKYFILGVYLFYRDNTFRI
jgi:hypothetical protein